MVGSTPREGKGICRHASRSRPKISGLLSELDTPLPTSTSLLNGKCSAYNFIHSRSPLHNTPTLWAHSYILYLEYCRKGVGELWGFWVGDPQLWVLGRRPTILSFVHTSCFCPGWCPVEWGGGSGDIFDPPRKKYCEYWDVIRLFWIPRCKYCEWALKWVLKTWEWRRGSVVFRFIPTQIIVEWSLQASTPHT